MADVTASREIRWGTSPSLVQRTSEDVYRSIKKHIALILGDDWDVRWVDDEGTFSRPSAIVVPTAVASVAAGDSQFIASMIQPFGIYAYPETGDTPTESRMKALAVEEILLNGLRFGVGAGRPLRIPLYSYRGVDERAAASVRHPSDFARVADLSVGTTPDPNDRTLWTVTCEVRLSWRRTAQVALNDAPIIASVTAGPQA